MEKKNIYKTAKVACSCGVTFETKSTDDIHVEVCSECHPFFTGTQTKASKAGRIEKFNKKFGFNE